MFKYNRLHEGVTKAYFVIYCWETKPFSFHYTTAKYLKQSYIAIICISKTTVILHQLVTGKKQHPPPTLLATRCNRQDVFEH